MVWAGANASSGQAPVVPVQLSATSHWPSAVRQTVLDGSKTSTQEFVAPAQWSVASQNPPWEAPVQVVVFGANTSLGQAPVIPVQLSATSHWPSAVRQTVLEGSKTS